MNENNIQSSETKSEEDRIIKTLNRNIVSFTKLNSHMKMLEGEDILRIKELDEDKYYKNEKEKLAIHHRVVAFVAVSQLLYYILLRNSKHSIIQDRNKQFKSLKSSYGKPIEIQKLFEILEEATDSPTIFKYKILSNLQENTKDALLDIIISLEKIANNLIVNKDILGLLFQRLLSYDLRKKISAYYTKPLAAELLCGLMIEFPHETIIDPACGSGTLLMKSFAQKKELLRKKTSHPILINEILGTDISPFATILTRLNLAIQNPEVNMNKIPVFNESAFTLTQIQSNKHILKSHLTESFIQEDNNSTGLGFDIVLANPPFTKGERLTFDERNLLTELSKHFDLKHGWKRWNLYAFFILLASEFLIKKEKGKIGFILPFAAISTEFMEEVWKKIFEKTVIGIKYIICADMSEKSFSDSGEQEIIIGMEQNYKKSVKMVQLLKPLSNYNIGELVEELKNIRQNEFKNDLFEGQLIDQTTLKTTPSRLWAFKTHIYTELIQKKFINVDKLNFVKIGQENVNSPIDYFYLPNTYWIIDNDTKTHIILKRTKKTDHLLPTIKEKLEAILERLNSLIIELNRNPSNTSERNHKLIKNHLGDHKILINDYKPNNIFEDYNKLKNKAIKQKSWVTSVLVHFKKLKNVQNITIPKNFLNNSMPRKIDEIFNFPPYLPSDIPLNYLVDYNKLLRSKTEDYYKWGELFKITVNNWVWAKPRPAEIFIIKRVGLTSTKILALRAKNPLVNTRFTSVIFIPKRKIPFYDQHIDVLFAYLTSSLFLYDYINKSRIDSGSFRRIYATDVRSKMLFPNIECLSLQSKEKIIATSKDYNNQPLFRKDDFFTAISKALEKNDNSLLRKLDEAWFEALYIPLNTLNPFYQIILDELKRLK